MKTRFLIALFTAVIASAAHAGPRTSANYSITTDTTDSGGARATSTAYTNDGSAGGASGLSSVASPSETAKSGYLGQLYEVTALQLAASPTTVNEGETRQLSGWEAVDDGSINALPATSITWSVMAGPFTGIDASGLATAAIVYEDTLATVQGDHGGLTGTLGLTVLNVNSDDLPGYNGDGIDDAWQVQYFGRIRARLDDGDHLTRVREFLAMSLVENGCHRPTPVACRMLPVDLLVQEDLGKAERPRVGIVYPAQILITALSAIRAIHPDRIWHRLAAPALKHDRIAKNARHGDALCPCLGQRQCEHLWQILVDVGA